MEPTPKQQFVDNLENELEALYNKYWQKYLTCNDYPQKLYDLSSASAILDVQILVQKLNSQEEKPEMIKLEWIYSKWDERYFTEHEHEIQFPEFTVIFPRVYYTHREEFGFHTELRVISNDDEVLMECDDMKVFECDYPKLAERVYARIANFDDESLRFAEVIW